eukprot:964616-Prorocentrum_minimum.AAC.3
MSVIEVDIPGKGRGLVAARDIRAGETVLVENPVLVYVVDEAKRLICANCLRVLPNGPAYLPDGSTLRVSAATLILQSRIKLNRDILQ